MSTWEPSKLTYRLKIQFDRHVFRKENLFWKKVLAVDNMEKMNRIFLRIIIIIIIGYIINNHIRSYISYITNKQDILKAQ